MAGKQVWPILFTAAALTCSISIDRAEAQYEPVDNSPEITYGAGVDVTSRYVWRGLGLSDDPNIQPSVWVTWNLLELGTWGSHSLDGEYHEQDFWATYYFPAGPGGGNLSLTVNDYYANPDFGADYFDFQGVGPCPAGEIGFGRPARCARGSHTLEVVGAYSSGRRPYDLLVAYNFHNDPEDAIYVEGSLRPEFAGFELRLTAGGVARKSEYYYGTDGAAVINLGAGVTRTLDLGPFSFPLTAEVIHNPHHEQTYYVARAGIAAAN